MTVTNNTLQTRNVHYRDNGGFPKEVTVTAKASLSIPAITTITQVIFSAKDQALRAENVGLAANGRTSFTTDFTVA